MDELFWTLYLRGGIIRGGRFIGEWVLTSENTVSYTFSDFTHSNPFDSTRIGGLRRKSGWKNGTRRPSNVDEVQRPIQLNPLPLPTSNSKNQMLSRDMNEQQQQQLMMSNKRPLDGKFWVFHFLEKKHVKGGNKCCVR